MSVREDRAMDEKHEGCLLDGKNGVRSECILAMKSVMKETQAPIVEKLDDLHRRMFVDNGKKSFQSSLSNVGVHIRLQWFFIGGIVLALISAAVKMWIGIGG